MTFRKPQIEDLKRIGEIMTQWTEADEVKKYQERIKNEINGKVEFRAKYFVVEVDGNCVGVGGISLPLPKVMKYTVTENPGEIKILYLDNNERGKGIGKYLFKNLEKEAEKENYEELIIRSAQIYRETAYGFYEHMGYKQVDTIDGGDPSKKMAVFYKHL